MNDWQTWAAPAVVGVTALIFLLRLFKRKKASGCGGSCGCGDKLK